MKYFNGAPFLILLLAVTQLTACKDEPPVAAALPANLVVTLEEDEIKEGLVYVSASAEKANYYSVLFEENGEKSLIESNDGQASYQYNETGNYSIIVKAHTTEDKFIQSTESIEITIGEPGNNGEFPTTGYITPSSYVGYTLVWQDEFSASALNQNDWNFEIGTGNGGWGNNELQYYLEENTSVSDGVLTIEAKKAEYNGSSYTSSRLTTQGKQEFKYGRIDIRAALPFGQGIWPALWMLGENISTEGWPRCGEIDIMELIGGNAAGGGDDVVHGTGHWDDNGTHASHTDKNKLGSGTFADEFHVFSIIWDNQTIKWYRDDIEYNSLDITPGQLSEFHQNFFFVFNVAVGGNWPGSPDSSTEFPQKMFVDYVRVFQK